MNIDKVYVINLKHRTDRKQHIIKQLDIQHITNYEIIEAVKPTTQEVQEWNPAFCKEHEHTMHPEKFKRYTIGCLGCLKSHFNIIKLALSRNEQRILILEDDTVFEQEYNKIFTYAKEINNEFDMLYLSGSNLGVNNKVSSNIIKVDKTYTTGSYIINKQTMEYFVKHIEYYDREVDVFYADKIQKFFNCYCIHPRVTSQLSGFSDIQQSFVDYKL